MDPTSQGESLSESSLVTDRQPLEIIILEYHQWLFNAPGYHISQPNATLYEQVLTRARRFEFGSAKFFAPFDPPLSSLVNSSLYIYAFVSPDP
jgi:hypothetical protein